MKGERTQEDREHVDKEPTKSKELKELMPDEAPAVDRAEKKTAARQSKRPSSGRNAQQARKRTALKPGSNRSRE